MASERGVEAFQKLFDRFLCLQVVVLFIDLLT
jgi:hypothetical protein